MRITIALSLLLSFGSTLFAQTTQEALEYMNTISEHVDEMKGETWSYLKAATRGRSARTLERKRQAVIEELGEVIREIDRLGPLKRDNSYRVEVLSYLRLTQIVMREDYGEIMNLEEIAEQSYDGMEAYLTAQEIASEKLDSAFGIYQDAQEAFATKYNINLVDGEMSRRDRRIKKASDALGYYNRVFLIVFKAQIQEQYTIDALNNNDLLSLEQSSQALKAAAEEGLVILDTMSPYHEDSDPQLILGARRVLNFYINEVEKEMPNLVDFFVAKDNFEQLKQTIDSKDQRDLSKDEIEEFNAAVEEFNAMVPKFNETNERVNERREETMEAWEDKVEDFFDDHA
ncbi:MAG: hypothetical protein EP346_03440 [Bacteroidetes bacterium]|uniref:Uncharacterized protein n=1 Tax=Phaeocystidibacter marisrubri TaxID=1577780 RepID=A0A6L3ZEG3_9FLAO|nr:hypothetical protein [Phaeocystidibacter marisrubri]KAB2815742.1 hypothetical protein F8C82_08565 [Phaeocystidibacter marisrubri]TNE30558.1 MAG: hypothetical protein EP346_03440 [Bacteroidota bacterium]GGH65483.1 hypothetical protein GCM10011318_02510 [Phaeocystidibacter marisrubri]